MALVLLYPLFRQARSLTLPQVGGRTMIAIGKALREMTAADLMSRELTLIPQDMSLPAAAHVLARAGISGAPVRRASVASAAVVAAGRLKNSTTTASAG